MTTRNRMAQAIRLDVLLQSSASKMSRTYQR